MVPSVAAVCDVTASRLPGARRSQGERRGWDRGPGPAPLEVRTAGLGDPLVRPLLEGLAHEYRDVLGHPAEAVSRELTEHPPSDFEAPTGCLLLLLDRGEPVAGGAYRRFDGPGPAGVAVAELKRVWTAPSHRRRGLARRVLAELEQRAATAGYERVHLTTGVHQHAAQALYLTLGYARGQELLPGPGTSPVVAFGKALPAHDLARVPSGPRG
ncbi:ribosomal protein S18 acetylase RimI-like enzyme [Kineococcus xinjiangensis]|uniref:Ribosomal protein S18 acetylase RimI-like enzyme n=1 Tax=Kineococcus xinjiangensis TaxID=512762 RepID=A0A2S6IIX0_9ACTN|nr:ribosomal protein S18 acetylase RimI-like enzyme [Kineococcus xinjiangensis]